MTSFIGHHRILVCDILNLVMEARDINLTHGLWANPYPHLNKFSFMGHLIRGPKKIIMSQKSLSKWVSVGVKVDLASLRL